MKRLSLVLGIIAVIALLSISRRDLNEPHLRIFSDMVYTPAYRSQKPNPIFRNGATMQPPVPGTIPRDFTPVHYGKDSDERERAGRELKNPFAPSFEVMTRGKQVYDNFCSHCHGSKGRGDGKVAKAAPTFSFPLAGKSTYDLPDGTLFHIITYGRNLMPSHASQISQADRWKVIHYVRDLERQEMARLGPLAIVPEDPRRHSLVSEAYGRELFALNCSACHGAEGRQPQPGIPMLNSPSVLAIANDTYYWDIINHGRRGTQMPAWKSVLTKTQILSIIQYIRSWAPPAPERSQILAENGNISQGQAIFHTHCAGCHGQNGQGGIGNSLNTPSFLALASDQFLRDTIMLGRRHTAMPSSYDLKTQDIADLIAFIRNWTKPSHTYADVQRLLAAADKEASASSAHRGGEIFQARCAGCHGENGEGGLGSVLNNDGFLSMANDQFLHQVILQGRPGTEMPSWHFLSAREVADLITYIRRWQKSPPLMLSTAHRAGRAEFGEVLFKAECVTCHGVLGAGELGPQIGNPVFLSQVSDEFLWRTIAYGKSGTEMKGFINRARNPLNEEDINHIVAYLRQLQNHPGIDPLKRRYSWASAKEGKEVFEKKGGCAKCHGQEGEGGSGPSLGLPGFLQVASDGFITATIIMGREKTPMQSYYRGGSVQLNQEDIENVVTYIRSFEKTPSAATRQVERNESGVREGKILFRENCARCHGPEGQGQRDKRPGHFAPSLNTQEFLNAADDNFLLATIALGRPGTPMPSFAAGSAGAPARLSADQIRKIVAFIRSWEKGK